MPLFRSTDRALERFTELFDFAWTSYVGVWNLRWQVQGFRRAVPGATNRDLKARFATGQRMSMDLIKTCESWPWTRHEQNLALHVLVVAFAVYEGWIESLLAEAGASNAARSFCEKNLQFPTTWNTKGKPKTAERGFAAACTKLRCGTNSFVATNLAAGLRSHRKFPSGDIEALLRCLRHFKETRNCVMHGNGVASARLVEVTDEYEKVKSKLGLKESPIACSPVEGQSVELDLRGVVGLTDLLMQVIVYTDAQVAESPGAQPVVLRRLRGAIPEGNLFPSKPAKAHARAKGVFKAARLEFSGTPEEALGFLKANGLV